MKKSLRNWRKQLHQDEEQLLLTLDAKIRALKIKNALTPTGQDRLDLLRVQRHRLQMKASTRARRADGPKA